MGGEATVFVTDTQIIRDYVTLRDDTLGVLINEFNAGLNNFETTIRSSSPTEAEPHIFGVLAKSAIKLMEKQVAESVKGAIGVNVAPVIELAHAINDEMERARTAATSLEVGNWIKGLRSSVNNVLTSQTSFEMWKQQYDQSDEGERSNLIADIGEELNQLTAVADGLKGLKNQNFECGLYEDWINAHFSNDCADGPGNIHIDLTEEGTIAEVTVNAPLGDRIEGAFNTGLLHRGVIVGLDRVQDIQVGKKVSIGDRFGCFDDRNMLIKGSDFVSDEQLTAGLELPIEFVRK